MAAAAQGADVIVNGLNPPMLSRLGAIIPKITAEVIAAAEGLGRHGARAGQRLCLRHQPGPWSAETPHRPVAARGDSAPRWRRPIAPPRRAGCGPSCCAPAISSTGSGARRRDGLLLPARRESGQSDRGWRPGVPRAHAYLPDLARAAVALAERRADLPAFADIPFAGLTFDGEKLRAEIERQTGRPTAAGAAFPWPMMRLLSPFWELARELGEMRYLYETPHRLRRNRLRAAVARLARHAVRRGGGRLTQGRGRARPAGGAGASSPERARPRLAQRRPAPRRRNRQLGRGQDVVGPQRRRSARAKTAVALPCALRQRVLPARIGEEGGMAARSPSPALGSRLALPRITKAPSGGGPGQGAVEIGGPEPQLVARRAGRCGPRARRRPAAWRGRPAGAACRRRATDRHVPMAGGRQPLHRHAPRPRGTALPSGRPRRSAPGRSRQSSAERSATAAASIGSRDRIAIPPWPANRPKPCASRGPPRRPSPSRSSPVAIPVLGRSAKRYGIGRGAAADQPVEGGKRGQAGIVVEPGQQQHIGRPAAMIARPRPRHRRRRPSRSGRAAAGPGRRGRVRHCRWRCAASRPAAGPARASNSAEASGRGRQPGRARTRPRRCGGAWRRSSRRSGPSRCRA